MSGPRSTFIGHGRILAHAHLRCPGLAPVGRSPIRTGREARLFKVRWCFSQWRCDERDMRAHSHRAIFTFPTRCQVSGNCPRLSPGKRGVAQITHFKWMCLSGTWPVPGRSGPRERDPPAVPRDPLPVPAHLAGAPPPPASPGGVEVQQRAAVRLAFAHGGPRQGVGEEVDGVAGEEGEEGGASRRLGQLPPQAPLFTGYGMDGRGRGRFGRAVDPVERVDRGAGARSDQPIDVPPQFPEPGDPAPVDPLERRSDGHQPGSGDPSRQLRRRTDPFLRMRGGQQVQAGSPGVESWRTRSHASRHRPGRRLFSLPSTVPARPGGRNPSRQTARWRLSRRVRPSGHSRGLLLAARSSAQPKVTTQAQIRVQVRARTGQGLSRSQGQRSSRTS